MTDPSGAVVNGATVTLTDTSTKATRTATTNDSGRYIFVDVHSWHLRAHCRQARLLHYQDADHGQGRSQATTANMTLQVGGSNVVVEVTAVGNELQTMNATVGNTVTAIALDNLPSIGRDVNTFIELQPGVSAGGDVGGRRERPKLFLAGWRQQQ